MAKSIRLLNVDVILNSQGKVIAGGDNSYGGQADGHSATAPHMMVTTSQSGQDIALLSFVHDGANNQSFAGSSSLMADGGYQEAVSGDNKLWMIGGIQRPSSDLNKVQYLSFTDNSNAGTWSTNLSDNFAIGAATSNGENAWTFGGRFGGSTGYEHGDSNKNNKINFFDSSSVTTAGSLSTPLIYMSAVNNNEKAIILGGQTSNSPFTHTANNQAFSLSSEGEAQQHSSLRTASYLNYSCNDLSKLFVHYGYDSGATTTLDTMSFAAGETSTDYASLTHGYGGAMASDGHGSGIAAGGWYGGSNNALITKFNLENNSNLQMWQTLNQARHHHSGASGNG